MFSKIIYLLTESIKGFYRAKLPAFISSLTIAVTLIVFSIALFSYTNLIGYSYAFKKQYQINVFFDFDLNQEECLELFNKVLLIDGIESGEFITKSKALAIYKNLFNEDIEKELDENPLPMSAVLDISSEKHRTPQAMDNLSKTIRRIEGVHQVSYPEQIVRRVDKIVKNSISISIFAGIVIFIFSTVLVSNTIRLIIYAKQSSIETLHLLGASELFIKIPFLIEGVLQGFIGSLISLGVLSLLLSLANYLLSSFLESNLMIPTSVILGNIFMGLILGLVGSYRSITKHLQ